MTDFGRGARIAAVIGFGLVAACAPITRNHGYVPPDSDLAQVEVGRDTREDVAEIVGIPAATGMQTDRGWYYVQSRFETVGPRQPQEVDREVVAISFSDGGTVSNVERFGLEEGRVVPLSRRTTEGGAAEISFLRQIFGNIGQINAGDLLGDE